MVKDIEEKRKRFSELLAVDRCFDMVERKICIGGRNACIYCIDGFTEGSVLQRIVQFLFGIKSEEMPENMEEFSKRLLPHGAVSVVKTYEQAGVYAMSGLTLLVIDGYEDGVVIDCRNYPSRGVEEPDKDKVMRGSRDGFTEILVSNIALIRRRIKSSELSAELLRIGESSKTDVALCYINDRADRSFVEKIRERLREVETDSLTMNIESLAECIHKSTWINPFPKFKYSERPDTTAASLLEGNVVVMVDNSPAAMIIPTSVFDIIEDADDYYFSPVTGTYLRLSRCIITILTLLVSPLYLLICRYYMYLPEWLVFTLPHSPVNVPILLQFLILEFAVDGLKLASLNTPDSLNTPLSVIAGIVVGEFAVSSGWFNEEVLLYMAFVTLANYSQSSFELGYALKFMRLIILIVTGFWGIWGFVSGIIFTILCMVSNKSVAGTSYLSPVYPMDLRKIMKQFLRVDIKKKI